MAITHSRPFFRKKKILKEDYLDNFITNLIYKLKTVVAYINRGDIVNDKQAKEKSFDLCKKN